MIVKQDYPASHAVMTLEDGETLQHHVLIAGVQHVASDLAGFWNVDLELLPDVMNANRDMLTSLGFVHAGTVSTNNVMYVRLRKGLRHSGDGGQATTDHVLHPNPSPASAEEIAAVELVSRLCTDGVEAKAAKLKADSTLTFDKPEPTSVPTFVERQNAADQSRIQSEIDKLMKKPEAA